MKQGIKKGGAILFLLFFLSGCHNNTTNDNNISADTNSKIIEVTKVDIDFDSVLSYTALVDDKIIYKCVDDSSINYFQTSPSGETFFLGSIPNFYLSMKQSVLDYPFLYFFVSILNDNVEKESIKNVLIRLNLDTYELEQFEHQDFSLPGISTYYFDDHIITLKNLVSDGTTLTYIESIDVENNEWKRYMECAINNENHQGTAVFGVCANQNNLFVLYDVCNSQKETETYLVILYKQYQEVKSIKIDRQTHDYVMTSFIADMQAFDDYIYIYNASNYGYLARIENNELVEIFKGRNFEISINHSSSQPIFYTRRSNQIYLLDGGGQLNVIELEIANNYTIKSILVDSDSCFITCYADDSTDFAYLVNREAIDKISLPCE